MQLLSIRSIVCLCAFPFLGLSVSMTPLQSQPLTVGLRDQAPFAFQGEDGEWQGIAVDLWEEVAAITGLEYRYKVLPLSDLLTELESGTVDVAVAALTISAERERLFDFTQPFMPSSLVIAAEVEPRGIWHTLRGFISLPFLSAAGALAGIVLVFGFLVWLFERRKNEQFGGEPIKGIGAGFWWSAVTMTTVGYGDKAPITLGGRLVGLVWMFAAIIIISGFTAAIASSLTANSLRSGIESLNDLRSAKVGVIEASSGAQYLKEAGIRHRGFANSTELAEALERGLIDAAVHDAPILRYALKEKGLDNIRILPERLRQESYALGLKEESGLLETVNRGLLEVVQDPSWSTTVDGYLEP
jgi:ABC-type amino acid transport substrate-binding protein